MGNGLDTFTAGDHRIEGRDAFLDAGAFPRDATTTMVAEAYQGDVAFQMYDAVRGPRTIRVVEQLTVRDGRIDSSVFVTDMAALAVFAGAGPAGGDDDRASSTGRSGATSVQDRP